MDVAVASCCFPFQVTVQGSFSHEDLLLQYSTLFFHKLHSRRSSLLLSIGSALPHGGPSVLNKEVRFHTSACEAGTRVPLEEGQVVDHGGRRNILLMYLVMGLSSGRTLCGS